MAFTILTDSLCQITDEMKSWDKLLVVDEKATADDFIKVIKSVSGDVYIITASDKLSSSYKNAICAKEMIIKQKNTQKNIAIFNSLGIGPVETIAALKIHSLASKGTPFNSVKILASYFIANKTECIICSHSGKSLFPSAIGDAVCGNSLLIKRVNILIKKSDDGALKTAGSAFTKKGAMSKLVREVSTVALKNNSDDKTAVISYLGCENEALELQNILSGLNIKRIYLSPCSNKKIQQKSGIFVAMTM